MPPLITQHGDVVAFEMPEMAPNFITQKAVVAELISDLGEGANLAGKIVLIPSADPGFDWIFTKNISGFVTTYGGANSHMAIRANELGLPAVIGVGEAEYNRLRSAKLLEIDCSNNHVRILQ